MERPFETYDRFLRRLPPGLWRSGIVLMVNWTHQGFFSLSKTDRAAKIVLEVAFGIPLLLALSVAADVPLLAAFALSFFVAHTLNWILDTNVHAARRTSGRFRVQPGRLDRALDRLRIQLGKEDILGAYLSGSMARGAPSGTSDIDIHVVRKAGLRGALRGVEIVVRERTVAFLKGIPLDIYLEEPRSRERRPWEDPAHQFATGNDPTASSEE